MFVFTFNLVFSPHLFPAINMFDVVFVLDVVFVTHNDTFLMFLSIFISNFRFTWEHTCGTTLLPEGVGDCL